jgi:taurine dioxygenase
MTLTVKPLDNIGVEVQGFDITQPWDDELQQQLRALWYEHGVLVFRNQAITPERQIAFSRIFGPLELHPLKATLSDDYPELFELESGGDKDKSMTAFYKGETIVGRLDWHLDLHYTGKPNHGAVLTAVEVAGEGGLPTPRRCSTSWKWPMPSACSAATCATWIWKATSRGLTARRNPRTSNSRIFRSRSTRRP